MCYCLVHVVSKVPAHTVFVAHNVAHQSYQSYVIESDITGSDPRQATHTTICATMHKKKNI